MTHYRCCEHCKDDLIHALATDAHEIPCNAPNSQGCIGKQAADHPALHAARGES